MMDDAGMAVEGGAVDRHLAASWQRRARERPEIRAFFH